jgi:hypothetical protein
MHDFWTTPNAAVYCCTRASRHALRRASDQRELEEMARYARRAEELRRRRSRYLDVCLQISIALLTLVAIGLVTSGGQYARWGHVAGLISQPLYIAATWRARQWGMLAVAVALCGLWARGIANTF